MSNKNISEYIDLSVVIPAHNEEKRIASTLQTVHEYLSSKNITIEIIVVDDGSTDKTVSVIKRNFHCVPSLKLLSHRGNQGKGAAVRTGILESTGTYILFMDADQSTPIAELPKLLKYITDYDIVIGSRYLNKNLIGIPAPWYRRVITSVGKIFIRSTLPSNIADTQCGFKLFNKDVAHTLARQQKTNGFGFDIELLARAERLKYSIKEVPVHWNHSTQSRFRPIHDSLKTFIEVIMIKKNLLQEKYSKK